MCDEKGDVGLSATHAAQGRRLKVFFML